MPPILVLSLLILILLPQSTLQVTPSWKSTLAKVRSLKTPTSLPFTLTSLGPTNFTKRGLNATTTTLTAWEVAWESKVLSWRAIAQQLGTDLGYSIEFTNNTYYPITSPVKIWDDLLKKSTIDRPGADRPATTLITPPTLPHPPIPHTDLSTPTFHITIVTTACLPWMTGTAVNPLLRASYLHQYRRDLHHNARPVTLLVPYLDRREDQVRVFGRYMFEDEEAQEGHVRAWLRDTAELPAAADSETGIRISFYAARQNEIENSIYSMGDITKQIPDGRADICLLEEPEHLNWYRAPGEGWTSKFRHVVGIIHTNYYVYALEQPAAIIRAPGMKLLCSWMVRAHCHKAIKLSGTLGVFAEEKEIVENVHGVRESFLEVGRKVSDGTIELPRDTVYFIGKMLWSKGLDNLLDLLAYADDKAGLRVRLDMYGNGPDKDAAERKAVETPGNVTFHGAIDHAELGGTHKIFVNPSLSEVLCTTSAEALAMGKFVILPNHPSNDFFAPFPNCLPYSSSEEFVGNLYYALTHDPVPLDAATLHQLSWEAATRRLIKAAGIDAAELERMAAHTDINISLPPIIEDRQTRDQVTSILVRSRARFRQFKSRLSKELNDPSYPLPQPLRDRLNAELEKEFLDLDLEGMIASPKMNAPVTPAALDKALLELYNRVSSMPGGDLLRVIGGGGDVARQKAYMRNPNRNTKNVPLEMHREQVRQSRERKVFRHPLEMVGARPAVPQLSRI